MKSINNELSKKIRLIKRSLLEDSRGWFLKIITGNEDEIPNFTGEIYSVCAFSGESRGGHYHIVANEWFTLISGKADLVLEDVNTKERLIIVMDSKDPHTVFVPCNVAHMFRNVTADPFVLIAYTDLLYDKDDTVGYNLK